jgi:hypothetical protein
VENLNSKKHFGGSVCVNERKMVNWILQKQDVAVWTRIKWSAYDPVAGSREELYFSSTLPLLHGADTLRSWAHMTNGKEFCLDKHVK